MVLWWDILPMVGRITKKRGHLLSTILAQRARVHRRQMVGFGCSCLMDIPLMSTGDFCNTHFRIRSFHFACLHTHHTVYSHWMLRSTALINSEIVTRFGIDFNGGIIGYPKIIFGHFYSLHVKQLSYQKISKVASERPESIPTTQTKFSHFSILS